MRKTVNCLDEAMGESPEVSLEDNSFIDHFTSKLDSFWDFMPKDNHANLNAHTTWYIEEDHETMSVMKVNTIKFPSGAWTKSICVHSC